MVPSVTYLGHTIGTDGIHPLPEKAEAINDAPRPTSVTELNAYLGILAYYSKFLPNMSTVLAPLYKLLQKDSQWKWERGHSKDPRSYLPLLNSSYTLTPS